MNKPTTLLLLILALFFTMTSVHCEEHSLSPVITSKKVSLAFNPTTKIKEKIKTKNKSTKSKTTKTKTKSEKISKDTPSKGYYGTLPDIEADFKYKQKPEATVQKSDIQLPDENNLKEENLKKAPYDDKLFLDNIVKQKDTKSQYVNDIQKTRISLEALKKAIEDGGDIQRFNASVNLYDLYSKNLKSKYENKSESFKDSYKWIMDTSYDAKMLGNLMYDASYYAKYIPTQQGKYSKSNIEIQKEKLLNKINKTLFLIYDEK